MLGVSIRCSFRFESYSAAQIGGVAMTGGLVAAMEDRFV